MVILNEVKDLVTAWKYKILRAAQNDIIQVFARRFNKESIGGVIKNRLLKYTNQDTVSFWTWFRISINKCLVLSPFSKGSLPASGGAKGDQG